MLKHFILELCCHIASYTIQLVTAGNAVDSYPTSTVDKTFFYLLWKSKQHFSLLLIIYCCYVDVHMTLCRRFIDVETSILSAGIVYNTQDVFILIFFICRDLLNCLRSVCTIVIRA